MTRTQIFNKYGILTTWTTSFSMEGQELYSETLNDPIITAKIAAMELANGKPYDVTLTMYGMELMEGDSMFEMSHREKMRRQKLAVSIVVFKDKEGYKEYVKDGIKYYEDVYA